MVNFAYSGFCMYRVSGNKVFAFICLWGNLIARKTFWLIKNFLTDKSSFWLPGSTKKFAKRFSFSYFFKRFAHQSSSKLQKHCEFMVFCFIPGQITTRTSTRSERLPGSGFDCPRNLLIQKTFFGNRRGGEVCEKAYIYCWGIFVIIENPYFHTPCVPLRFAHSQWRCHGDPTNIQM